MSFAIQLRCQTKNTRHLVIYCSRKYHKIFEILKCAKQKQSNVYHIVRLRYRGKILKSEKLVLFIGNVFFFLLLIFILGVHTARYYKLWEKENKVRLRYQNIDSLSSVFVQSIYFLSDRGVVIKCCLNGNLCLQKF